MDTLIENLSLMSTLYSAQTAKAVTKEDFLANFPKLVEQEKALGLSMSVAMAKLRVLNQEYSKPPLKTPEQIRSGLREAFQRSGKHMEQIQQVIAMCIADKCDPHYVQLLIESTLLTVAGKGCGDTTLELSTAADGFDLKVAQTKVFSIAYNRLKEYCSKQSLSYDDVKVRLIRELTAEVKKFIHSLVPFDDFEAGKWNSWSTAGVLNDNKK